MISAKIGSEVTLAVGDEADGTTPRIGEMFSDAKGSLAPTQVSS